MTKRRNIHSHKSFFSRLCENRIERTYKSECERFIGDYARLANEYLEKGIINNGTRAINDMLKIASEYHIIYKKGAPKK